MTVVPRRTERWMAVPVVLAAHLLLWWAWGEVMRPVNRGAAPLQPMPATVWMLPPPPQALPREPTSGQDTALPRARPQRRARADIPTSAAVTAPSHAVMPSEVPSSPITAPASDLPAIELKLPRGTSATSPQTMRDQVLNDPRANSAPSTVETRVAAAAGKSALKEERLDATRTRVRRDGRCVEVHVARNAQLDPWNQNHSPTAKSVKPEC